MKTEETRPSNTREYFRIEYPHNERPRLRIGENEYHAVNISEKGGKFCTVRGTDVEAGGIIIGTITFRDGESMTIVGEVLRTFDSEFVVCFTQGIPFKRIIKEQRLIMKKYKHSLI